MYFFTKKILLTIFVVLSMLVSAAAAACSAAKAVTSSPVLRCLLPAMQHEHPLKVLSRAQLSHSLVLLSLPLLSIASMLGLLQYWPQTPYVAKDDLEFLILLLSPLKWVTMPDSYPFFLK